MARRNSLRASIARWLAPELVRGLDAAGGGRRWGHRPYFGPANSEAITAAAIVPRARHAAANNAWAANGVGVYECSLVGPGIESKSAHPDAATRKLIGTKFKEWTRYADADGVTDWFGLQSEIVRALVTDGEAFVHALDTANGPKLRQLPREMIDESRTDGNLLIAGIQFAADGSRLGYYVFPQLPSSLTGSLQSSFVPADQILHIFKTIGAGAVRGVSWFAPVLLTLSELDQWSDAQLVSAKVQAMLCGFLVDQNGVGQPFDGETDLTNVSLEPATLRRLPQGYDVKFTSPQQMQSAMEFGSFMLRAVAAGLQCPEHRLTGDMRQVNYSSARTAEVAFRQRCEALQFHLLIPQLIRPVWERVIRWLVLSGQIEAKDFESNGEAWLSADHYPPAVMWIDPKKDADAQKEMVDAGFVSRRQVVASLGFDIEQIDEERAADAAREKSLGLEAKPQPGSPQSTQVTPMQREFTRAASLAPSSYDAEKRTIDVRFTEGADVPRYDAKGPYIERLSLAGMDLGRFIGASVLNSHRQSGLSDVLGVVLNATKKGIATLQLSARDDVAPLVQDIAAGIIRFLSVGYRVHSWAESTDPKSGARIKTATRWSPHELSFVPVPADFGATTRSTPVKKNTAGAANPAPENDELETEHVETTQQAVTRNQAIRKLCSDASLSREFENSVVDSDMDMIAARSAINAELIRQSQAAPAINPRGTNGVGFSHEDPTVIRTRQVAGFVADANGTPPPDNARAFAGLSTMQHFREMLDRRGINTRRMNDGDVLQRAFGSGDAPIFLQEVLQASVLQPYEKARDEIMGITIVQTVPDFRPYNFLRGELDGGLEELTTEHSEFTRTPLTELKNSTALRSFARGIDITERAIRNDNKGLFVRVPAQFAAMAAQKDAELVMGVITDNPSMDDSIALFHADHSNLTATPTPLSVDALSDGRLAMRSLVGIDGETPLNIAPKFLIVSKELETVAEKLMAQITPAAITDVQPIKLQLIVSGRLPAYQWMLAADPAQAPCLAVLRLSGQEGPRVEQTTHWNTFGIGYRVSHHCNAAAIGWRGLALWTEGEDSNSVILE